jgi:hypothetical protein
MSNHAIDMAMHDIADNSGVGRDESADPRYDGYTSAVERMQAARRHPRQITARELVPLAIHDTYTQRWQAEDRALMAAEAARLAQPKRGWLRRLLGF